MKMVDSTQKWKYPMSFGTFSDLNSEIDYIKTYMWQQKEYLTDEERDILNTLLSHYLMIQVNLRALYEIQK